MDALRDIDVEPLDVWTRPRLFLWLVIIVSIGTMMFFYHWLAPIAEGHYQSSLKHFINEMTGAFSGGLLVFPLAWLVERMPLRLSLQRVAVYVALVLVFAVAQTTMMWGSREVVYRLVGLGDYDYGRMPLRYFMELPFQLIALTLIITVLHGLRHLRLTREREIQVANLETSLARAQLQNLRLQLQPHFLFNALNTVSSKMYDDPGAADEMLDSLSELLRISLRSAQTDEVPLSSELATLDCYLGIMRARFGDRLEVAIDVEPGLSDVLVPSMILQPLVENAVRHGNAERNGHGKIVVRAKRAGTRMSIEVEDDGPGTDGNQITAGTGLSTAAERLRLLYGEDHAFSASGTGSGFRVAIEIPRRLGESGS